MKTDPGEGADASYKPLDPVGGYVLRNELPPLRPPLQNLYRAFQEGQWHPDDGSIDWSQSPIVEDLFIVQKEAFDLRRYLIADTYYGKQLSLRRAGRRLDALSEMDEKLCYGLVIVDEHRHTEVFGRYQQKLSSVCPPDPRLVATLSWVEGLDVEAYMLSMLIRKTIVMHTLPVMWRSTRDPLLRDFLPQVHQDEIRHEAFSRHYLMSRAPRWTAGRAAALSALASDLFERQRRYMTEPSPLITFPIPQAITTRNSQAAQRCLRSSARILVRRLAELEVPPGEEIQVCADAG